MKPAAETAPLYLRLNDVARQLQVTRRCVTYWITAGRLKAVKLGPSKQSAVRVAKSELERFLAGGGR